MELTNWRKGLESLTAVKSVSRREQTANEPRRAADSGGHDSGGHDSGGRAKLSARFQAGLLRSGRPLTVAGETINPPANFEVS